MKEIKITGEAANGDNSEHERELEDTIRPAKIAYLMGLLPMYSDVKHRLVLVSETKYSDEEMAKIVEDVHNELVALYGKRGLDPLVAHVSSRSPRKLI